MMFPAVLRLDLLLTETDILEGRVKPEQIPDVIEAKH